MADEPQQPRPKSGEGPDSGVREPAQPIPGMPPVFPDSPEQPLPLPGMPPMEPADQAPVPPYVPPTGPVPPYVPPNEAGDDSPRRGRMTVQEPGATPKRKPTVAEARARDKARREAEEAERLAAEAAAAAAAKRRKRKRGAIAVAGVAAVVAGGYLAYRVATKPTNVTASCIVDLGKDQVVTNASGQLMRDSAGLPLTVHQSGSQWIDQYGAPVALQNGWKVAPGNQVVVDDDYCDEPSRFGGTNSYGGGGLYPIFIHGGHQYHYYYGGSGSIGHPPTGGTMTAPKHSTVHTKSGSVVRGGFGSKSAGSGS